MSQQLAEHLAHLTQKQAIISFCRAVLRAAARSLSAGGGEVRKRQERRPLWWTKLLKHHGNDSCEAGNTASDEAGDKLIIAARARWMGLLSVLGVATTCNLLLWRPARPSWDEWWWGGVRPALRNTARRTLSVAAASWLIPARAHGFPHGTPAAHSQRIF